MKKYITFTNILILALAGLILFTVFQCNGNKRLKSDVEKLEQVKNENAALIRLIDSISIETSTITENAPVGITVKPGEPISSNSSQVIKSEKELRRILEVNASLLIRLSEAEKANRDALAKLQKDGQVTIENVPIENALPIVETVGRDSGEYFTLHSIIHSRGDLIYKKFDVKVKPQILKVNVPEISIQDNTKKNFLGLQAGAISQNNIDLNELQIPVSILYINKNFGASGGVILDNQFKGIQGFQASLIAGIKW